MAAFRASEPLSVEEIVQQAGNFDYNQMVPLRYWLRSADTIQKEVRRPSPACHAPLTTSAGPNLRTRRQ